MRPSLCVLVLIRPCPWGGKGQSIVTDTLPFACSVRYEIGHRYGPVISGLTHRLEKPVGQMNKLWAYLCTGIVLFLLVAAEEAFFLQQWHQTLEAQQQRSALREEVLRLRRLVADIDSGFRGYALMRQSVFLAPMVAAEAELPQAMQRLSDLTVDRPSLQESVRVLRRRVEELVDIKRQLTLQLDDGKHEKALAYIRTGDGVVLSKTVSHLFDDLDLKIEREFKDADLSQAEKQIDTMWKLVAAQAGVMFVGVLVMELLLAAFAVPQRQEI